MDFLWGLCYTFLYSNNPVFGIVFPIGMEKLYALSNFLLRTFHPIWYEAKEEVNADGKKVRFHGFETTITGEFWKNHRCPSGRGEWIGIIQFTTDNYWKWININL